MVINDALMDNHQTEVAEAMHDDNYLTTATSPAPDVLLTKASSPLTQAAICFAQFTRPGHSPSLSLSVCACYG